MITNKRNKNLGELIGGHTLQGGKVFKSHLQINQNHATQRIYHLYVCYTQVHVGKVETPFTIRLNNHRC